MTARTIEDVLLGEAVSGSRSKRLSDMIAIASTIKNRMSAMGRSVDEIIAAPGQFSAYGRALPKGVEQYRELARKAWAYVQKAGPTHSAMFYATPAATKNLPKGLQRVTSSAGHVFFSDPQNRAIQTTQGYMQPARSSAAPSAATQAAALRAAAFPASARRGAGMLELTPSLIPQQGPDYSPLSVPGKGRNQIPTSGIADKVDAATKRVIPGARASVWSGMEPAGHAPVGTPFRHPLGYAGDFDFYGPNKARITDPVALQDIAMTMAAQHNANIGYGETGYMGKGRMHIDTMPLSIAPGAGPQWGRTAAGPWAENLNFARQTGIGPTPYSNAPTPSPRAQAIAEQEQTVREIGARGGMAKGLGAAGIGNVGGKPLEEQRDPEISRYEERRRNADANRAAARASAPQGGSHASAYAGLDRQMPTVPLGMSGPMQNPSPNIAELAAERRLANTPAITRPPNISPQLTAAMPLGPAQGFQPGAPVLPAFVSGNAPMPPGVPAPPLGPPRAVAARPVGPMDQGQFPAAPTGPNYRPADVYAGRATSAADGMGNTVSRDAAGNIGITNKYGATTYSRDGLTTAAGLGGPLGEIDTSRFNAPNFGDLGNRLNDRIAQAFEVDPSTGRSRFGNGARQLGGSMAGAYVGGLGGPLGSLLGAAIGQELAKPRGGAIGDFMRGVRTIETSRGLMEFARPVGGLGFPSAPGGGSGNPRESNRSDREMREISPRAAEAISRGRGGLY